MRLFFALLPSVSARQSLHAAAAALGPAGESRLVPADNFHVTLTFLGEIANEALGAIREIGAGYRASCGMVSLTSFEYWPDSRVIVAVGDNIDADLSTFATRLQKSVSTYRAARAWEPPWRPHVTLARKVLQAPVLQALSTITWTAHSFSLMSSERRDGESVYTVVDTWSLLDKS